MSQSTPYSKNVKFVNLLNLNILDYYTYTYHFSGDQIIKKIYLRKYLLIIWCTFYSFNSIYLYFNF